VLGLALGALASTGVAGAVAPRQLVEVVDIANPVVSPDGRRVAFRTERAVVDRDRFETVWYVQDLEGASAPTRVGDGGFPLHNFSGLSAPPSAVWSTDGRWIFYLARIEGRIDVWRAAADGSGAGPVTLDPADVRDFALSADGRHLQYRVGATRAQVQAAEREEFDRGVRIDETVPLGQSLYRSGYTEGRWATQRVSNNELERVGVLGDVPERWKTIDLDTRVTGDIAAGDAPVDASDSAVARMHGLPEPWAFARDAQRRRIAMLTRVGDSNGLADRPGVALLALADMRSRRPVECGDALCTDSNIISLQWRPDSDEVLYTVADPEQGYAQSVLRWNVTTGAVQPVVRSRGLVNGGRSVGSGCGVSAQALVCVAAEADRPPRLERIDLESGERRVLFAPNVALDADMEKTAPATFLRWTDASGRVLTGQYFAAKRTDGRAPPLVINYYRCYGFLRGGTGDEWPLASLARDGISALCINFAPLRLDAVERYDEGLSAVRSAVDLLASAGEIDRSRVGMGGLSLGAEVTFWTVMHSDLLAAASVSSPRTSPLAYLLLSMKAEAYLPRLRRFWQLGAPDDTPERWRQLSPLYNLDRIQTPMLMQLPEQEYIHALDYAIPLIRDLRADLYVFPGEAHFKYQPRHKLAAYERNLEWFKFWLLGTEDSDPSKRAQYARWREMKARFDR